MMSRTLPRLLLLVVLILSLFFLITPPAHAKTFTYYKGVHPFVNNTCYTTESSACSDFSSKISNANTSLAACRTSSNIVEASFTSYSYNSEGTLSPSTGPFSAFAEVKTQVCGENEKLELNGCETSCVPDNAQNNNKCAEKSGQTQESKMQCGIAHGTGCHWTDETHMLIVCDSHDTNYAPLDGTNTSIDGCEATISNVRPSLGSNGAANLTTDADPASSMPVTCDVTLTITGAETPPNSSGNIGNLPSTSTAPSKAVSSPNNSSTKTNPDGSSVKTTSTTKTNADGSKTTTTTTETTDKNGVKTTTTSTKTTGENPTTCDPSKSICEGSGDGNASTGSLTKPTKIENTVTKSWWETKYPNGIKGVWDSHQSAIDNTPFVQSLNQFKQGVPNSGSCPAFSFTFLQYSGSISPPCIIWPFLRAVFLFSTMMLCRRIVFGG
ncbi:MAG: hypothetical protein Q7S87_12815 [Agitococcus sp.]|nr:hypothetical protein [Agitococcus sp.]